MNKLNPIFNRSAEVDTSPVESGWYQLAPRGEYPHGESGLIQVLDDSAITAMVNRFKEESAAPNFAGLLVDQEHWSYEPDRSSESYGWLKELANRDSGLWGRIEWTDLGAAALGSRRYKFISPVWMPNQVQKLGNKRIRPLRLDSAGLTNNPNLRGMVPLTNRAGSKPADTTATKTEGHNMKSVAAALGLSAEASEEAILAAVTQLRNRAETAEGALAPMKNRVTTLESDLASLRDAQVEQDLKPLANRATPEVIESHRASLKANRTVALPALLGFIAALGDPGTNGTRAMTNRAAAGNPDQGAANGDTKATQQEAAIQEIRLANRCSYKEASTLARRRKPELFAAAA